MPETDTTSSPTVLIFRSQSGRTEVARRPDGTLHVSVLTGTDMFDWPELERLVDVVRAAGRKQAAAAVDAWADELAGRTARNADQHETCACGKPMLVLTGHAANKGIVAATRKAARIAEDGEPRG